MKLGQLVKYNKRNIFFKNCKENEEGRLVPDLFLFIEKALSKRSAAKFQYILIALSMVYNKNKAYKTKTIDPEMFNFNF